MDRIIRSHLSIDQHRSVDYLVGKQTDRVEAKYSNALQFQSPRVRNMKKLNIPYSKLVSHSLCMGCMSELITSGSAWILHVKKGLGLVSPTAH